MAVGGVCCRLLEEDGEQIVYIVSIGVLAPYRRRGLGRMLIENVLQLAQNADSTVKRIRLHVQTSNPEAREFYEKFGFRLVDTIEDYYPSEAVKSAWLLEKEMEK